MLGMIDLYAKLAKSKNSEDFDASHDVVSFLPFQLCAFLASSLPFPLLFVVGPHKSLSIS